MVWYGGSHDTDIYPISVKGGPHLSTCMGHKAASDFMWLLPLLIDMSALPGSAWASSFYTRVLIHLHGVINPFRRAFLLFISFSGTFYFLGNLLMPFFLGHLSFLLPYTSQACMYCVLPGPFFHCTLEYYPWIWLPEQQRLISPLSSHTLHRSILSSYVLKVIRHAVINDHWRLLEKLQNNSEPRSICNFHRWFTIITQNESCLSCGAKLFFSFLFTAV